MRTLIQLVEKADGLIISSPEYVHAIPGGLKNAVDWLVSGKAIIHKPIVLAHASPRGEDMLASLRLVLGTVSSNFNEPLFLRFQLLALSPMEIQDFLLTDNNTKQIQRFLSDFTAFVRQSREEQILRQKFTEQ